MWRGIAIFTFFGTKTCKSQKIVVPLQGERQKMYRHAISILVLWLLSASLYAEDSLPIIEVKADRTMIYPQRMDLNGEETLQDILQMMPDLMISGYDDVIDEYNLRIDNSPINGDTRLILSQMKAKDIATIQVCTNTGVAKGTIGIGKVLDINMAMPDTVKGLAEAQCDFGKEIDGNGTVNVLYGSERTDLYANASYHYQKGHKEHVSLHMTNRFDERNRLLTYLTQQYLALPGTNAETMSKIMGRARYFHTFNEAGTELLVLGGYQYADDPLFANQLPMFVIELNTPLPVNGLTLMAGVEGDYLITKQKETDTNWNVFNHDIYLQLTYSIPKWRFTVGNRVMLYNYRTIDSGITDKQFDTRNNTDVSVIYMPNNRHQVQLGYYRKFYNPVYPVLLAEGNTLLNDEWAKLKGLQDERDINQIKLAYAYSRQTLTVQTEASYYIVEGEGHYGEIGASAYWKTKWVTLTGGTNLYVAKNKVFASLRLSPTAYLPHNWQIGLQVIYFTPQSPMRVAYGTPVYGCLSVNKQIGTHWNLGVDWHDMFDTFCSTAITNRHAANVRVQYRF